MYALIICMRLLAVIGMRLLTVLYYVHVLFIESTASLSDEDAVYLIESVVGGLHICKRARSPTVCEGLQPFTRETETMTVLLRAGFRCRYFSSVCRAVGHPG